MQLIFHLVNIVFTCLLSHPQGRSDKWRVRFAVGRLRRSSKACQPDAELGRLQWGESVQTCEPASAISGCRWLLTGSRVFLCAAGGSSMLVWKLQRLWDYPAHHGGEQAAVCHHAFSCTGWVCAGSRPAGLASRAKRSKGKLQLWPISWSCQAVTWNFFWMLWETRNAEFLGIVFVSRKKFSQKLYQWKKPLWEVWMAINTIVCQTISCCDAKSSGREIK